MKITRILSEVIKREEVTIYRIAKAIGVDRPSLSRALKDGGNPGAKTIEKVLMFLGYEIRLVKSRKRVGSNSKEGRTKGG